MGNGYANFMFADNESVTLLSPTAVFLGAGPANFPGSISPGMPRSTAQIR